jgi:hypothetical protein
MKATSGRIMAMGFILIGINLEARSGSARQGITAAEPRVAAEYAGEGSFGDFFYGDACIRLLAVADDDIAAITAARNVEEFGAFCRRDPESDCAVIENVVSQFGFLSENGEFCSFVPIGML